MRDGRGPVLWVLTGCTSGHDELPGDVADVVSLSDNDGMVLEKRFGISLSGALSLRCTSPDDPLEDHRLALDGPGELRLYGLLGETRYECALTDATDASRWTGSFDTAPLPEGLPEVVVTGDADVASIDGGYLLFSHTELGIGGIRRSIAMDPHGQVRWYRDFPEAIDTSFVTTWLGDQLVVGGARVTPSLLNLSGEVLFSVGPPVPSSLYHHEALLTPIGLLSLQDLPIPPETDDWSGFRIEVTRVETSEVVWSFDSETARLAGLLPVGAVDQPDPYHTNAVAWRDDDPEGPSVWVSMRGLEELMRIDRTTGAMTLVGHGLAELVDLSGAHLPRQDWFWGQHAPDYHGDEFLLFDNGNTRPPSYPGKPRYSRLARFRRDSPDVVTLVWDWTEPGWFEPFLGMASELPDGHVLVASGHTRGGLGKSWILELDPQTEAVVWRLDFTSEDDTIYRAQAVDGCSLFANRRFCPP